MVGESGEIVEKVVTEGAGEELEDAEEDEGGDKREKRREGRTKRGIGGGRRD